MILITIFSKATVNANFNMMELLIKSLRQKNLINIPDRNGLNVAFYAIKSQRGMQILKLLIEKNLINLEFVNKVNLI